MPSPFTMSGTLTADPFQRLDVLGGRGAAEPSQLHEAVIQAQSNGVVLRFGDEAQPADGSPGLTLNPGAGIGIGPVREAGATWDLRRIWVRNATAGSNGTVVATGVVR